MRGRRVCPADLGIKQRLACRYFDSQLVRLTLGRAASASGQTHTRTCSRPPRRRGGGWAGLPTAPRAGRSRRSARCAGARAPPRASTAARRTACSSSTPAARAGGRLGSCWGSYTSRDRRESRLAGLRAWASVLVKSGWPPTRRRPSVIRAYSLGYPHVASVRNTLALTSFCRGASHTVLRPGTRRCASVASNCVRCQLRP